MEQSFGEMKESFDQFGQQFDEFHKDMSEGLDRIENRLFPHVQVDGHPADLHDRNFGDPHLVRFLE